MEMEIFISYLIGGAILVSFGSNSFNTPPYTLEGYNCQLVEDLISSDKISPQIISSKVRFRIFKALYLLFLLVLYLGLVEIWPYISGYFGFTDKPNPILTNVLVAMVISGVLPYLPFIQNLLSGARNFLHHQAQIPLKARNLYSELKDSTIRDDLLIELSKNTNSTLFEPGFFTSIARSSRLYFPRVWLRYCYLFEQITKGNISKYIINEVELGEFSLSSIRANHDAIYRDMKELREKKVTDYSDVKIQIIRQLKLMYSLITCSLIRRRKSLSESKEILEAAGFEINRQVKTKFNGFNELLLHITKLLGVIVTCCVSFYILKIYTPDIFDPNSFKMYENPVHATLVWLCYSVFLFGIAFFVAYYGRYVLLVSEMWVQVSYTQYYKTMEERPWKTYMFLFLVSYILTTIVFRLIYSMIPAQSLEMGIELYLWPFIPSLLTLFICYRFDSIESIPKSNISQEPIFFTSIIQGGILCISSYFIMECADLINGTKKFNISDIVLISSTDFFVGFFSSFFMGFSEFERRKEHRLNLKKEREEIKSNTSCGDCELIFRDISASGAKLFCSSPSHFKGKNAIELIYKLYDIQIRISARVVSLKKNYIRLNIVDKEEWSDIFSHISKKYSPLRI